MKKSNLKVLVGDSSNSEESPIIASSKREAIKILECGGNVSNLNSFNDSYSVMYSAVTKDGSKLGLCSDRLKKNQKLVYAAILSYSNAIFLANPMYMKDKTAIIYAFISSEGELSLKQFDPEFSKDYDIAFFAVKSNKDELDNVDLTLRNNNVFMNTINEELERTEKKYRKVV